MDEETKLLFGWLIPALVVIAIFAYEIGYGLGWVPPLPV
jgi:hypothetical protein